MVEQRWTLQFRIRRRYFKCIPIVYEHANVLRRVTFSLYCDFGCVVVVGSHNLNIGVIALAIKRIV